MKRTLILGGKTVQLDVVGQPLDRAFDWLHEAYVGNAAIPWEEFSAAATEFFDANPIDADKHNAYFQNFTVLWRNFLLGRRYEEAEAIWHRALMPALGWEQANPGRYLHKGTPYYFWAMTSLLRGDTDRGYLLAHQALAEDIRTDGTMRPDSPAYALVSLKFDRVDQAFYQWVRDQADFVDRLLSNYCTTHNSTLKLDDVQDRFLTKPPSTETLFLLTYTVARLMNLGAQPEHTVANEFAGQLELNLLFDLTLVIDHAIRQKNQSSSRNAKFIDQAVYLLKKVNEPLKQNQLGEINQQYSSDFDCTRTQALDGTLATADHALSRIQCDVALAYGLRNHGAHNTNGAKTIWKRFREVQEVLFRALFLTIDHCY